MPSKSTTRKNLRRKMVLPVTVIRKSGQEKHIAHTLDLTEFSARLGGLSVLLEPGEIIELQRGAVRTKFQVFWMGSPRTAMDGQAGVRALEDGKTIWGIGLPPDERDPNPQAAIHRDPLPSSRSLVKAGDQRWHTRFECSGVATVRPAEGDNTSFGQVKDISIGGVYVETPSPMPVNSFVHVKLRVEGVTIETPGVVRTYYPQVGMGISFQKISAENQDRLIDLVETLRRRAAYPKVERQAIEVIRPEAPAHKENPSDLATACTHLADEFDVWKQTRTEEEIETLRQALVALQQKLSVEQHG